MLVALAALLIQPQLSPRLSFSAERTALAIPAAASAEIAAEKSSAAPESASLETPETPDAASPLTADFKATLPEAPVPTPGPAVIAPAPAAFIKPSKSMTIAVGELVAENRRKEMEWRGLLIAAHGGAAFDAWSTRRAITAGAQELNPLLKPFAGNASLYAAIQVAPLLMDYAGKKMMYSRHSWVRHMWWAPQTASLVSSVLCGTHNLSFH